MIEDLLQAFVISATAQKDPGGSIEGIQSVWDFDPDVIPDCDYPALTLDYTGGPGRRAQTANGFDMPFEIAVTLYTAALEAGDAKRQLRGLMYAGDGKGVMAWVDSLSTGYVAAKGRVYKLEVGRVRTGISHLGATHSAAASVSLTVISRGRN